MNKPFFTLVFFAIIYENDGSIIMSTAYKVLEMISCLEQWAENLEYQKYLKLEPSLNMLFDKMDQFIAADKRFYTISSLIFEAYIDQIESKTGIFDKDSVTAMYEKAMSLAPDARLDAMKSIGESASYIAIDRINTSDSLSDENKRIAIDYVRRIADHKCSTLTPFLNHLKTHGDKDSEAKNAAVTAFEECFQEEFRGTQLRKSVRRTASLEPSL